MRVDNSSSPSVDITNDLRSKSKKSTHAKANRELGSAVFVSSFTGIGTNMIDQLIGLDWLVLPALSARLLMCRSSAHDR